MHAIFYYLSRVAQDQSITLTSAEAVLEDSVLHPGHLEERLAVVEEALAALGGRLPVDLPHHLARLGEGADGAGDVVDEEVPLAGRQVAHRLLQLQLLGRRGLLVGRLWNLRFIYIG